MAVEGLGKVLLVQDVALQELNLRTPGYIPFVRRREVVEDENTLYVEPGQGICKVGTDSARAAGHKNGLAAEGFGRILQLKPRSRIGAASNPRSVESPP